MYFVVFLCDYIRCWWSRMVLNFKEPSGSDCLDRWIGVELGPLLNLNVMSSSRHLCKWITPHIQYLSWTKTTPFLACFSKNDIAIVLHVSWKKQCKRTAIFQMPGCWNNAEVPIQIVGGHGTNTVWSTWLVLSNMFFLFHSLPGGENG